jgi:hypothetical protein
MNTMEKLKFALVVVTVLLAFPVITILELNRNPQSIQLQTETGKAAVPYAVNAAETSNLFKKNNNRYNTLNNAGNKKGHIKYAL